MKDGLPHNAVRWVAQTPDKLLWVGTALGVARFDGAHFKVFGPTSAMALADVRTKSLCADPDGALWVLDESGFIARHERGQFFSPPAAQGLSKAAHGLYSDGAKLFVLSDVEGRVFRLEDNRFVEWLNTSNAATGPFMGINVDLDGTVWVRHGTTLSWWDGERWQRVIAPDGSTNFVALKTGPCRAGGMWVSSSNGLRRLRRGVWDATFLAYEDLVPSVQAVIEDRGGNIWVTHGGGQLLRFDPSGRLTQLLWHQTSADNGVKHIFEDADGNLWLAMDTGLTRLRAKSKATSPGSPDVTAPNVVLDEVLADGHELRVTGSATGNEAYVLPAGLRAVEFRFTGVSFDAPLRLQFRHRLDGFDNDWRTGARRVAVYSNLPPGRLCLRLAASYEGGAWDGREISVDVMVPPQLWETLWFRTGAAVIGLGAVSLVWQRREILRRRAQAQQDQFCRRLMESQESERKRIASELHDSLGQNLLLIKNRAVMGLKENASSERMREQLQEISQASTDSVEEIRSIARALRPYQLDRLGLTKTLEDVAASVTTAGGLHIKAAVDNVDGLFAPEAEIGLYRIVQEGLSNVLKHAQAKSVRLVVQRSEESVRMELTDDGRGFHSAQKDGFGLNGLRERVRLLGGVVVVMSAPGQGTQLQVSIPLPSGRVPDVNSAT